MRPSLAEVVKRYLAAAHGYGNAVPLSSLGFTKKEIEDVFTGFDEDYHISRFFQFSRGDGKEYQIDGFSQTHVSIDSEIQSIL